MIGQEPHIRNGLLAGTMHRVVPRWTRKGARGVHLCACVQSLEKVDIPCGENGWMNPLCGLGRRFAISYVTPMRNRAIGSCYTPPPHTHTHTHTPSLSLFFFLSVSLPVCLSLSLSHTRPLKRRPWTSPLSKCALFG